MAEPDGLVEWLTAQIDEDEQSARDWRENYSPQHPSLVDPDRVLAEIAANRAILAFLDPLGMPEGEGRYVAIKVLRLLGSAYADRDGYREGWRP